MSSDNKTIKPKTHTVPKIRLNQTPVGLYGNIGIMSHDVKYIDDQCVCDTCISAYLELYERIERLSDILWKWKSNLSAAEKDKINAILSRSIQDKTKPKKKG